MYKETKDLAELLEGYETDLCNKIFCYQLNHKIDIDIVFYLENFCHLLGIQHIYGKEKKYLGANGYSRIKNKEISRSDLKKHNKKEYNKLAIRLDHFEEIYEMLQAGQFIKFYQCRTVPYTTIVADFIIYHDKKEYILHLFLKQESRSTNQYSPVSFVVKSGKDRNKEQFIKGQEYKKITSFKIISKSENLATMKNNQKPGSTD